MNDGKMDDLRVSNSYLQTFEISHQPPPGRS